MLITLFKKIIITDMDFNTLTSGLNKLFIQSSDNKYKILSDDFTLIKYPYKYVLKTKPIDKHLILPNITITNNTFSNKIEIKTTLNIFFIIAFIILSILMGFMVFITFQLKENDGATRIFQLAVIFIAFTLIYRNIKYCKEALETVDILLRSIDK